MSVHEYELGNVQVKEIDFGNRFRKEENYGDLDELIATFKTDGIISPLAVYRKPVCGEGEQPYLLLAGGRRFRAICKWGALEHIPCKIYTKELNELQIRSIEFAENYYRKNLEWQERVDLAAKIHDLQVAIHGEAQKGIRTDLGGEKKGWSQTDTAKLLGKSQAVIAQDIQLSKAMEKVPELKTCKTADDARKLLESMYNKAVKGEVAKQIQEKQASTPIEKLHSGLINSYIINDFFNGIEQLPDRTFNLVEVDPPYAINLKKIKKSDDANKLVVEGYNEVDQDDYVEFMQKVLGSCYKKMTDDSWLILWFAPDPWFEVMAQLLDMNGFKIVRMVGIWTKPTGQSNRPDLYLANSYEMFFYARKGNARIARPGRTNVFQYKPVDPSHKVHPTERPIEMIQDVLQTFGNPGDRVLVPFCGSGNTLLAASNSGMTGIGFDLTKEYKDSYTIRVTGSQPGKYTSYNKEV